MSRIPKHHPLPVALHRALPLFEQAARVGRQTDAVPTPKHPLEKWPPHHPETVVGH